MKLYIASDIHGSAYWCRKMLEAYKASGAQKLVLLGDILYHGPRNDLPEEYNPKAVIEMLNPLAAEILAVRGNCESEVDGMVLAFPVCADYGMIADENATIMLSHGHRAVPAMPKETVYLTGHTHVPLWEELDNCRHGNPGSVSIPKEGSAHSVILYEGGLFQWMDLENGQVYREIRL